MAPTGHPPQTVVLGIPDLVKRLEVAKAELEAMAPAPRVELNRDSILALVSLCLQALRPQ